MENAKLSDFLLPISSATTDTINNEWLLRVYRDLNRNLSGLLTVDKRSGTGYKFGVGVVYKVKFN